MTTTLTPQQLSIVDFLNQAPLEELSDEQGIATMQAYTETMQQEYQLNLKELGALILSIQPHLDELTSKRMLNLYEFCLTPQKTVAAPPSTPTPVAEVNPITTVVIHPPAAPTKPVPESTKSLQTQVPLEVENEENDFFSRLEEELEMRETEDILQQMLAEMKRMDARIKELEQRCAHSNVTHINAANTPYTDCEMNGIFDNHPDLLEHMRATPVRHEHEPKITDRQMNSLVFNAMTIEAGHKITGLSQKRSAWETQHPEYMAFLEMLSKESASPLVEVSKRIVKGFLDKAA